MGTGVKKYRTLSASEASEFLNRERTKRTRVHNMTGRICHWPYCVHCGLVALKNRASRLALRRPCVTYE